MASGRPASTCRSFVPRLFLLFSLLHATTAGQLLPAQGARRALQVGAGQDATSPSTAAANARDLWTVECGSGPCLVAAIRNHTVSRVTLVADVALTVSDWGPVTQLPAAYLYRNLTITGATQERPATLNLGFLQNYILLAPSVILVLESVILQDWRRVSPTRAPGLDIFSTAAGSRLPPPPAAAGASPPSPNTSAVGSPSAGGAAPVVFLKDSAITYRVCGPPEVGKAAATSIIRPTQLPGANSYQAPASRWPPYTPRCVNSTSVPPLERCWPRVSYFSDYGVAAYNLGIADGSPFLAGYLILLQSVYSLCHALMPQDCMDKMTLYGCENYLLSLQYMPSPLSQPPLPGAPALDGQTADGRQPQGPSAGLVVGAVLGSIAGAMLAAVAVYYGNRRRPWRHWRLHTSFQGHSKSPPGADSSNNSGDSSSYNGDGLGSRLKSTSFKRPHSGLYWAGAVEKLEGERTSPAIVAVALSASQDGYGGMFAAAAATHTPSAPAGTTAGHGACEGRNLQVVRVASTSRRLARGSSAGEVDRSLQQLDGSEQTNPVLVRQSYLPPAAAGDAVITTHTPQRADLVLGVRLARAPPPRQALAAAGPAAGDREGMGAVSVAGAAPAPAHGPVQAAAGGGCSYANNNAHGSACQRCMLESLKQPVGAKTTNRAQQPCASGDPGGDAVEAAEAADGGEVVTLLPVLRGRGMFGRVYEGLWRGHRVAVKLLLVLAERALLDRPVLNSGLGLKPESAGGYSVPRSSSSRRRSSEEQQQAAAAHAAMGGTASAPQSAVEAKLPLPATDSTNTEASEGKPSHRRDLFSLEQEVAVLGRCCHPNVVRLLAACLTPPRVCLVMELMDTSLDRLLYGSSGDADASGVDGCGGGGADHGRRPSLMGLAKVLHIADQIAAALEYLHPTVVHRDLKPANVLLNDPHSEFPVVKLTDFGLSRLRATGTLVTLNPEAGTPSYLAPECYDTSRTTIMHQSDMYSLGVMIWAMLTGARPWQGCSIPAVAYKVAVLGERPPLEQLSSRRCPPRLRQLVRQCWEPDPLRRPAAAEAAKELGVMLRDLRQQAQEASGGRSTKPPTLLGGGPSLPGSFQRFTSPSATPLASARSTFLPPPSASSSRRQRPSSQAARLLLHNISSVGRASSYYSDGQDGPPPSSNGGDDHSDCRGNAAPPLPTAASVMQPRHPVIAPGLDTGAQVVRAQSRGMPPGVDSGASLQAQAGSAVQMPAITATPSVGIVLADNGGNDIGASVAVGDSSGPGAGADHHSIHCVSAPPPTPLSPDDGQFSRLGSSSLSGGYGGTSSGATAFGAPTGPTTTAVFSTATPAAGYRSLRRYSAESFLSSSCVLSENAMERQLADLELEIEF